LVQSLYWLRIPVEILYNTDNFAAACYTQL